MQELGFDVSVVKSNAPCSWDKSTVSTAPLLMTDETSSNSVCHLQGNLGNGISTGENAIGRSPTKGRE